MLVAEKIGKDRRDLAAVKGQAAVFGLDKSAGGIEQKQAVAGWCKEYQAGHRHSRRRPAAVALWTTPPAPPEPRPTLSDTSSKSCGVASVGGVDLK